MLLYIAEMCTTFWTVLGWLLYHVGEDALDGLPDDADDDQHDREPDGGGGYGLDHPQHTQTHQLNN